MNNVEQKYLLSIYIPTYNRSKEALRQVRFLLKETEGLEDVVEIVVSDNCSPDETEEQLRPFCTQIKYHKNQKNLGISGNLYILSDYVKGKYIWIIGDDDILDTGVVAHVIDILRTYQDLNFVFLNWTNIGKNEKKYKGKCGYLENAADMLIEKFRERGEKCTFTTSCIYKKEFWDFTTINIPVDSIKRYGSTLYAAMAAVYKGKVYFDKKIWIYNSDNISWKEIINDTRRGSFLACDDFRKIGYTSKQIKSIYRQICTRDSLGDMISVELFKKDNMKNFIWEIMFFLKRVPLTLLKNILLIFCYPITRAFEVQKKHVIAKEGDK